MILETGSSVENHPFFQILDDGSVQVLFPDGAVSKCQSYPIKASKVPIPSSKPSSAVSRPDPSLASSKKNLRGPPTLNQKPSEEPLVPAISVPEKVPEWSSTGVKGNRIVTGPEGDLVTVPDVHCSLATCPQSGQVSIGYIVVTHKDKLSRNVTYDGASSEMSPMK